MKITIEHDELLSLLKEKEKLVDTMRKANKKHIELMEKLSKDIREKKEDVAFMAEDIVMEDIVPDYNEYMEATSLSVEKNKVVLTIIDQLEEFKETYKKIKEDKLTDKQNG